jgi:EAL domain-containing protein (putative c-di-GMP-specific phosphodiesterase class I)
MESSSRQAALVGSIVHLARALELRVVAEGVETTAQRDALLRAGGGLAQGYLFSGPVPADEIVPWLLADVPRPLPYLPAQGHITAARGIHDGHPT